MIVVFESGHRDHFGSPLEAARWSLEHWDVPVTVRSDWYEESEEKSSLKNMLRIERAIENLRAQSEH